MYEITFDVPDAGLIDDVVVPPNKPDDGTIDAVHDTVPGNSRYPT